MRFFLACVRVRQCPDWSSARHVLLERDCSTWAGTCCEIRVPWCKQWRRRVGGRRKNQEEARIKKHEGRRKKEESRTFHSNLETLTWKVGNRWLNHHSLWFPDDLSIFKYHTFGLNQQNIGSKQRTLAVLHMEPQVRSNTFHQGFGLGRGTSLHSLSLLLIDSIHSCPFYHVLSLGTRFSDG